MRRIAAALVVIAALSITAVAVAASVHRSSPTKLTIWVGWSAGNELTSFKALAAEYVALNHETLETKVHQVPRLIDQEIARLKLASKGIQIDELTKAQRKYLASWDQGT